MAKLNENIERIPFRLKDLLMVIQDKEVNMKLYLNDVEIEDEDDIARYMNHWVVDTWPGIDIEDCQPVINISVSDNIEIIYIKNFNN